MAESIFKDKVLPIVALRGSVVFPRVEAVLTFGRSKSKAAVSSSFSGDRLVAIFTQKDARISDPTPEDLYEVGTIGVIQQLMPTDNEVHVLIQGQSRIKLSETVSKEPFMLCKVEEIAEQVQHTPDEDALAKHLSSLFEKAVRLGKPADVQTVMRIVSSKIEPVELADQIAYLLDLKTSQKQELLELTSLESRLQKVTEYLTHEIGVLELEKTISTKTQKRFEEQMRRAMLKERQKTIEQELKGLGEDGSDEDEDDLDDLKKKIIEVKMPKDVKNKAEKELRRLTQMSPHNPEGGYIRNYLDWLVEMPWNNSSAGNVSISDAAKVLDDDHYALKNAKERILEFLAVMQIKNGNKSKTDNGKVSKPAAGDGPTILCFIGPPGVGKTSIGKSIAKALGRKFVRVSLGGVRDEAEIRGHRRTYVGALPGRIIQGIKNSGTNNPVFMLDEIDKLGMDFRGDPSSALLEALDPEQNSEFSDHYLEVPFDLSQVMFICTGNVLDSIPGALRDRMEVITFAGYTEEDKFHIAKEYLWQKQLRVHGLDGKKIDLTATALKEIIARYTREAGVRNLERHMAKICRKTARTVAEAKPFQKKIDKKDVAKYLGPQYFTPLIAEAKDEVGMSTGLAVTAAGGEIIFIETVLMPGKGKLTITGQLGEVMKESAQAAFSYARSHWRDFNLDEEFAKHTDIHIHVPEGAVPKDGPSAGIAIATSLISALTNTATKRDVGMTGEVTLRGRVLPIGGVKEKVIAGHRAGLKTIILPIDNKKDMEDVPENVKKDINFVFAEHLNNVLDVAFDNLPRIAKKDSTGMRQSSVYD